MRIRNSGTAFGGFGGGGGSRSDSFKQKHKRGQKVKGILLKRISDDMAWVSIDGDKLLAQLDQRHQEGARLTFRITQLTPDIILKEVFEFSSGSANSLNLASSFDTARTLFENQFRPVQHLLNAVNPVSRLDRFLLLLASTPSLYARFKDVTLCAQAISKQLESNKTGQIYYQPWLMPNARRQITFVRNSSDKTATRLIQSIIEFEHDTWGIVRTEFLYKNPQVGYKLKLQHLIESDSLMKDLTSCLYPEISTEIECLGITKLPPSSHGSILTEALFKAP